MAQNLRMMPFSRVGTITRETLEVDDLEKFTQSTSVQYTATNYSELDAAIAQAMAEPHIQHTIFTSGTFGVATSAGLKTLSDMRFSGLLVDPHAGIDADVIAADATGALQNAKAVITGGSLTIKSIVPFGTKFLDAVSVRNAKNVIFDGIWFAHTNDDKTYFDFDENSSSGSSFVPGDGGEVRFCVEADTSANVLPGTVIFQGCRIGAGDGGANPSHYVHGILDRDGVIAQDCEFDGLYRGLESQCAGRTNIRRCTMHHIIEDGVTFYPRDPQGLFGSVALARAEIHGLVLVSRINSVNFAGVHSDTVQYLDSGSVKGIDVQFSHIYSFGEVFRAVHPSFPTQFGRFANLIYSTGASAFQSKGKIVNCIGVTTRNNGIVVPRGGIEVKHCTVLPGTFYGGLTNATIQENSAGLLPTVFTGNLAPRFFDANSAAITPLGNDIGLTPNLGLATSFDAKFAGPFTAGVFGPRYDLTYTDADAFIMSVDAAFRTIGSAATTGHLIGSGARPAFVAGISAPSFASVSPTTGSVAENGIAGTPIVTFTISGSSNPGAITLTSVTPANAVKMNANGRTLEIGTVPVDFETQPIVTFNVNFTDDEGAKVFPMSFPTANVAAPAAPADTAAALIDLSTGTTMTLQFNVLPNTFGQSVTRIEYSLNNGTTWVNSGLTAPGSVSLTGLTDGVQISVIWRVVTIEGNGAVSNPVVGTPNNPAPTIGTFTLDTSVTPPRLIWDVSESGTFYWLVDTAAIHTPAEVAAGGGSASGNFSHTEPGPTTQAISLTSVTAGDYTLHATFKDLANKLATTVDSTLVTLLAGDVTAPVLTAATQNTTGTTTADVGFTTDEGNGTAYVVIVAAADAAPSKAQIKAGQNAAGTAAIQSTSLAITTTGAKVQSLTSLTPATGYKAHFMHEDASGNQSNVLSTATFTTSSVSYTENFIDTNGTYWISYLGTAIPSSAKATWFFAVTLNTIVVTDMLMKIGGRGYIAQQAKKLRVVVIDSANVTLVSATSVSDVFAINGYYRIQVDVDLTVPSLVVTINGSTVAMDASITSSGTGLIPFNRGTGLLSNDIGTDTVHMKVADVALWTGTTISPSTLYNGGTPFDLATVGGTPKVLMGGPMKADADASGDAAKGWNDGFNRGSITVSIPSATAVDV